MYYTGSACVHRSEPEADGTPRPVHEEKFMRHGVWGIEHCNLYYAREATNPHAHPCGLLAKPTYRQMTANMQNYGYMLVKEGTYDDGSPDYRCPRCRGTEPQSRTGRKTKYPRQPDWNKPGYEPACT